MRAVGEVFARAAPRPRVPAGPVSAPRAARVWVRQDRLAPTNPVTVSVTLKLYSASPWNCHLGVTGSFSPLASTGAPNGLATGAGAVTLLST